MIGMFDIDRSDETIAVTELARSLAVNVLEPAGRDADRLGTIPPAVSSALFDTGLMAPVHERHGGGGIPSTAAHLAAVEALAHGDAAITAHSVWSGAAALVLGYIGTEAQQARWLPHLGARPGVIATALYEGFGASPSEFDTLIMIGGVAGSKLAVCGSQEASHLLVIGSNGAAIVDPRSSGVTIGVPPQRLALNSSALSSVGLVAVEPLEVFGPSDGFQLGVSHVRLLTAALSLGNAQRSIEYAAAYANERIAFGKPIASFQGVSFMLAEAALRIGAARLEMVDVAWQIDAAQTEGLEQATTRAVNYACTVSMAATRDAVQVLGGHGFITDHPVERWYRVAATLAALDHDPLLSAFEPAL